MRGALFGGHVELEWNKLERRLLLVLDLRGLLEPVHGNLRCSLSCLWGRHVLAGRLVRGLRGGLHMLWWRFGSHVQLRCRHLLLVVPPVLLHHVPAWLHVRRWSRRARLLGPLCRRGDVERHGHLNSQ